MYENETSDNIEKLSSFTSISIMHMNNFFFQETYTFLMC